MMDRLPFQFNDGGRSAAGYDGYTGDCVVRAISIATGKSYKTVYDDLFQQTKHYSETNVNKIANKIRSTTASPRTGVYKKIFGKYLQSLGWTWVPTMFIGQGCKVHLRANELPGNETLIVSLSRHITVVSNGVIMDIYDPSRQGTRCVYGYYRKAS